MKKVPVIAGEFGESYDGSICGTTTLDSFMNWMDQHQSSYFAWVWDAWGTGCADLSLITNYDGTPKSPNGSDYRNHLRALGEPTLISLPTPSTAMPLGGDINHDNVINILDYNILLNCLSHSASCTPSQRIASDLNSDGLVNQFDYNSLLQKLASR